MGVPRLTCGRCPKWTRAVCLVQGKIMLAAHPVCEFGRRLIRQLVVNESVRKWRAKKKEVCDGGS